MRTVCEFETTLRDGTPAVIEFYQDTNKELLMLVAVKHKQTKSDFGFVVKVPANFQRRLAVHNLGTD